MAVKNVVFRDVASCKSCEITRRHIPKDGILYSLRRDNNKSHKTSGSLFCRYLIDQLKVWQPRL
jgi:hypothetical protein